MCDRFLHAARRLLADASLAVVMVFGWTASIFTSSPRRRCRGDHLWWRRRHRFYGRREGLLLLLLLLFPVVYVHQHRSLCSEDCCFVLLPVALGVAAPLARPLPAAAAGGLVVTCP